MISSEFEIEIHGSKQNQQESKKKNPKTKLQRCILNICQKLSRHWERTSTKYGLLKCKYIYRAFRYYELPTTHKNVLHSESEREGGRTNGFKWIKFDTV